MKFNKILVLDTEGIESYDGRENNFDKRIVFYSLCVSHFVIIANN
jgi:hypothetical protein